MAVISKLRALRPDTGAAPRITARQLLSFGTLALVIVLGACSAATFGELPSQIGGLPAGTPERPVTPAAYPAVHDMPPPRSAAVLTEDEQKKAEAELIAARKSQSERADAAAKEQ